MAYQETTKTSYGKRLGNSLSGILFGFVLLIGATVLLWWNEGRAVKTSKMLNAAGKECVDVADISTVDVSLNGTLIHAIAVASTEDVLTDPDYPVSENAIQLVRDVEYYQWIESTSTTTKDKIGGGQETVTTYNYSKAWTDSPVNSSEFKDPEYQGSNTILKKVDDSQVIAQNVSFGAYQLPASLVRSIPCDTPVELPADVATDSTMRVIHNVLYYGKDPDNPQVGDVRVTFKKAVGGQASILAKVVGNTFEPFTKNGKSLCTLSMGSHSMESMFESEKAANKALLWIIRLVGIILAIAGFRNIFDILVTLFKVLPPLSKVVGLGVGLVTGILGFVWALIIIIIAWIVYRPVLAIVLLVVAAALIVWMVKKSKKLPDPAPVEQTPQA